MLHHCGNSILTLSVEPPRADDCLSIIMMSDVLPLRDPVLIFSIVAFLILLSPIIMGRWRLPGMIGLLLAGAVLGPNALGVLARDQSFVLFGTVGLLYIMFIAALEIDMGVLKRYRSHSVIFGLLTFAIPQATGTLLAYYLLDFKLMAALLLGSVLASHTLLAYPVASRLGLSKNQAVTTVLGGTIVTDSLALLILAVIAGATRGEVNQAFWIHLAVSLSLYVFAILVVLPVFARAFFKRAGKDGVSEFVFVLAVVFGCASLSHLAGSEPIVGAFLAGLALNRLIPHNGTLMNRLQFTGDAIFIPFFLLSVGMLLDAQIFLSGDAEAWLVAGLMIGGVMTAKLMAALLTRWLLGYSTAQVGVVYGLSLAQAAATLAATVVGFEIGLFNEAVVNGAILMILVTCVMAPWLVDFYGRRLALAGGQDELLQHMPRQRVLVGLSSQDELSNRLLDLAMLLRLPTFKEPIYPLMVVEEAQQASQLIHDAEKKLERATLHLSGADVPSHELTRIELSWAAGILRARRERRITGVIVGWSNRTTAPERFFGSVLETLLSDHDYSLLVSRLVEPLNVTRRVLLIVPPNAARHPGFSLAVLNVKRLVQQLGVRLLVVSDQSQLEQVCRRIDAISPPLNLQAQPIKQWSGLMKGLDGVVLRGDVLLLCSSRVGSVAWRSQLGNLPARLAKRFPTSNLLILYPSEPVDTHLVSTHATQSPPPTPRD